MKRLIFALLLTLSACASPKSAPRPSAEAGRPVVANVDVVRKGDRWTADFRFARASPVWPFARSPLTRAGQMPWRPQSWTVETPGVRLERRGRYDVFAGENGRPVPERVRIRFAPFGGDVIASYDPALIFTDGSVALYSKQFDAFPVPSLEEAERLPLDLMVRTSLASLPG